MIKSTLGRLRKMFDRRHSSVAIHPLSDVQTKTIGRDTTIWQFVIILPDATIGSNCNINAHTFIENNVRVGNRVTIKCGVYLWDGIEIEDDVFIGPNATFVNDNYPRSKKYPEKYSITKICKGASIGANATILGEITIGEYALVGAGSVVTKDVPPFTLVSGNPASIQGKVNRDCSLIDRSGYTEKRVV
ncbi:MAG: isoleucine patch superfamily enzyme carbonic anhydrase/acetyltransferase [Chitinophagaceae bacterium]|nr:isoleucine patch superfamily enzyme carbonic anhydrase/acetyltransferase [Chitinophagaceae bacterium]